MIWGDLGDLWEKITPLRREEERSTMEYILIINNQYSIIKARKVLKEGNGCFNESANWHIDKLTHCLHCPLSFLLHMLEYFCFYIEDDLLCYIFCLVTDSF